MIALIIAAGVFIYFLDGRALIQNKQWRELAAVCLLLLTAVFLEILSLAHIPLPTAGLDLIFRPLGELILK